MKGPRCIAICYIQDGSRIFVGDGFDPKKNKKFYRPLGGGVEWQETAEDAVAREFREEMGADLKELKFETIFENMFTFDGRDGHEIVLVFSAQFTDPKIYQKKVIPCVEDNGMKFNGLWIDVNERECDFAVYPEGLLEYISNANQSVVTTPDAARPIDSSLWRSKTNK